MNPKQRVAEAAIAYVKSEMVVGLGTGSTADFFLQALGNAIKTGRLNGVRGIPTSRRSEQRALELGIALTTLAESPEVDITIDGTDEVDPKLDLIKGLGGAMLREKMLAQNCRRLIILADASKRVDVLGTRCPLPVEVVPFCHEAHVPFFEKLGATPILRRNADGSVFVTDNGNYIYDCRFAQIKDPAALEATLARRAGVVECGLFVGIAQVVLIADDHQIEVREKNRGNAESRWPIAE